MEKIDKFLAFCDERTPVNTLIRRVSKSVDNQRFVVSLVTYLLTEGYVKGRHALEVSSKDTVAGHLEEYYRTSNLNVYRTVDIIKYLSAYTQNFDVSEQSVYALIGEGAYRALSEFFQGGLLPGSLSTTGVFKTGAPKRTFHGPYEIAAYVVGSHIGIPACQIVYEAVLQEPTMPTEAYSNAP